jgi:hypothetical protein
MRQTSTEVESVLQDAIDPVLPVLILHSEQVEQPRRKLEA